MAPSENPNFSPDPKKAAQTPIEQKYLATTNVIIAILIGCLIGLSLYLIVTEDRPPSRSSEFTISPE